MREAKEKVRQVRKRKGRKRRTVRLDEAQEVE
jgi:hypothetical protein